MKAYIGKANPKLVVKLPVCEGQMLVRKTSLVPCFYPLYYFHPDILFHP